MLAHATRPSHSREQKSSASSILIGAPVLFNLLHETREDTPTVMPNVLLLVLCLLLPLTALTLTPLICTTRSDAVAVVAAACQVVVDCRSELGSGPNALPLTSWDVLLTTQSGLLSDSGTVPLTNDARRYFIPEWYITLPLMAYDAASMDAVDCAPIAAAPQTDLTDAVFALLDALSKYQRYVSNAAKCADVNQVALWTNATGTPAIVCQCAPGKVCSLGNDTPDAILQVAGIFIIVLGLAFVAFSVVSTALALYRSTRYIRHLQRELRHTMKRTAASITSQTENIGLGLVMAVGGDDMNIELSGM